MPRYIGYYPTGTANSSVTKLGLVDTNTVLYLNMDGSNGSTSFTDLSPSGLTVTALGDAQVSTAQSKFGGASALFDGTGDSLSITGDSTELYLTSDFTIEGFLYTTTLSGVSVAVDIRRIPGSFAGQLITRNGSTLEFYSATTGAGSWDIFNGQSIGTMTVNTWHHFAVVRAGNTYSFYFDGTRTATVVNSSTPTTSGTTYQIGSATDGSPNFVWNGYIDDIRILNGTALYSGASITVPTAAVTKNYLAPSVDKKYNSGIWYLGSGVNSVYNRKITNNWPKGLLGIIEYLIVAGGGGGGYNLGGGGGAGGFRTGTITEGLSGSYPVVVGAGGSADSDGNNSSFNSIVSAGGGHGGIESYPGNAGGSGGGGGGAGAGAGGAGNTPSTSPSQGNPGGAGSPNPGPSQNRHGGGGGGAGGTGDTGTSTVGSGDGGAGALSSITGAAVYYAGGGGGGSDTDDQGGDGTTGGGGNGGDTIPPTSGAVNKGAGGGGGQNPGPGAAGGSGIVIIRYSADAPIATGGTITSSGGYQIHTFTSSGTFEAP